MKLKLNSRLKISFLIGLCFVLTTFLFNNCSGNFKTIDDIGLSVDLASESEDPNLPPAGTGSEPSTPPITQNPPVTSAPGPTQPAPAPIEPIETTNTPAWMSGKSLNEWIEIPNTSGAGGAALFAFSGLALRESNSELIIGAAGGHLDSSDNRVVSLVLETDAPKWQLRIPSSPLSARKMDVPHYLDGTPSSRHTYQTTFYIEPLKRLFLYGNRGAYGTPFSFMNVDAFNMETNQWDPPNTWAPLPTGSGYGSIRIPGTDNVFTTSLHMWSASSALAALKASNPSSTSVWSLPITTRTKSQTRWPMAFDKARNQIFTLQWADGMGYGTKQVFSSRVDLKTGVQTDITFKPNAVLDLFIQEKPTYAAMDYDSENDRFLFYGGFGAAAGRIYEIKPLIGNEWEMQLFATTANSLVPPPTPGAGINANFKYIPRLKGFVMVPPKGSNILFMRTAQ